MRNHKPIDVDRCNELFEYRDGQLIRKVATSRNVKVGDVVGSVGKRGYKSVRVDYISLKVSRIIYAMHHGDPEGMQVDHINHDRLDNRIENLRLVTNQMNLRNATKQKRSKSGFTGVSWDKLNESWMARIGVGEKDIWLGRFKKKRDAIFRRKLAEIAYGFHPNHGS